MKMEQLSKENVDELKVLYEKFRIQAKIPILWESGNADSSQGDTQKDRTAVEKLYNPIFSKLDEILSKIQKTSETYNTILAMKASVYYETAKILLNNHSIENSKNYLEKGLDLIEENKYEPLITFLYMRIVNYFSYVLSILGDCYRARTLLETIIKEDFKCVPIVYTTEELFFNKIANQSNSKSRITKIIINNMQMLGWIYGKLGLNDLYADIIHKSLQKQLDSKEGDNIQWAIRCCRLASLFINQNKWNNAIYHLTAAQSLLDPLETCEAPNNFLFEAQADMARIWINYGLQLFSCSKKSLLERFWEESDIKQSSNTTVESIPNKYEFTGLQINLPNVPTKDITNLEDANKLFTHTYQWLKRARFFYSLRDYPLQYVNIILELSELYRFLAYYEKNVDEQYGIQKKRYDTLENLASLVKEIRPSCYFSVSVEIIKEIMEVQIEMMNLNLKKIYNPHTPDSNLSQQDLKKRVFTVIDMSTKMNSICTESKNKEDTDAEESTGMVHPEQDETNTNDESSKNFRSSDEITENGEVSNKTNSEETNEVPIKDQVKTKIEEVVGDSNNMKAGNDKC